MRNEQGRCTGTKTGYYLALLAGQSVPLLATLKLRLDALAGVYAPSEGMGKAVAYFLRRWDDFTRYTDFKTVIRLWQQLKLSETKNPLLRSKLIQADPCG